MYLGVLREETSLIAYISAFEDLGIISFSVGSKHDWISMLSAWFGAFFSMIIMIGKNCLQDKTR